MRKAVHISFFFIISFLPIEIWSQCAEDINYWADSWTSCEMKINPNSSLGDSHWILYEFNEAIEITSTHIWNANKTAESHRGVRELFIHVSYDGSTWLQIGTNAFIIPQAPETTSYQGFAGPALNQHGLITKILFTIQSTYGTGECASIAEVRFDVNPDACDGIIDLCDVCNGPGKYTYYLDADNDGLGNPDFSLEACQFPDEGYVTNNLDDCDTGGWAQMGILFESNGCTGCHNETSPSGLNLLNYDGFINGGNKCAENLRSGTTLVDIITIEGYAGCDSPIQGLNMNDRVGGLVDELELLQIQAWIDAGAPEFDCTICPNFEDDMLGTPCDDNDPCTDTSIYGFNCECTPRVNLALTGTASMSSVYSPSFDETFLNNGIITNTDLCATTENSLHEWIQIDLGEVNLIKEIVIWNRINCCLDRQNNIYVLVSENPFPANTDLVAALANADFNFQIGDVSGKETIPIQIDELGRYVRIQKSGDNGSSNIMNIHEMQVFGESISADADGDGVCDADDICPGGDDTVDSDNDGTPDFCDACIMISESDFETDEGIWTSGGDDSERVLSGYSPSGSYSMRIRDNSFEESAVYSSVFDASQIDLIKIHFDYQAVGMDAGEEFYLEISIDGGLSFTLIRAWKMGAEFMNNQVYQESVEIPGTSLSANTVFQFRCFGTINSDEVYLDNIQIESCEEECVDYIIENQNDQLTNSKQARLGIESNQIIPANANVDFNAGEYILLDNGFEVKSSAVFHAYINGCQ